MTNARRFPRSQDDEQGAHVTRSTIGMVGILLPPAGESISPARPYPHMPPHPALGGQQLKQG
jgi:hypothetical protein